MSDLKGKVSIITFVFVVFLLSFSLLSADDVLNDIIVSDILVEHQTGQSAISSQDIIKVTGVSVVDGRNLSLASPGEMMTNCCAQSDNTIIEPDHMTKGVIYSDNLAGFDKQNHQSITANRHDNMSSHGYENQLERLYNDNHIGTIETGGLFTINEMFRDAKFLAIYDSLRYVYDSSHNNSLTTLQNNSDREVLIVLLAAATIWGADYAGIKYLANYFLGFNGDWDGLAFSSSLISGAAVGMTSILMGLYAPPALISVFQAANSAGVAGALSNLIHNWLENCIGSVAAPNSINLSQIVSNMQSSSTDFNSILNPIIQDLNTNGTPPVADFEAKWINFSSPTPSTSGISYSVNAMEYNTVYGNSWRMMNSQSSYLMLGFNVSEIPSSAFLTLTHLTSYSVNSPGYGYSPIDIYVNNELLIENYDVALAHGGSHSYETDLWQIESLLITGNNFVSIHYGDNPYTHYWIQTLGISQGELYGVESHLIISDTNVPSQISHTGGSYPITVTNDGVSTLHWAIENVPSWVTVNPNSGSIQVSQNVTINVSANSTIEDRFCGIRFFNTGNNNNSEYTYIYQNGISQLVNPSDLFAVSASSSQINLNWVDNSTNETCFDIESKTGSGGTWAPIAQVNANLTTYQNTGLNPNTTYYYRVRASNTSGNSGYSNEAFATTGTSVVNDVTPRSITFSSSGSTQLVQVTSSGTWYVSTLDTYWVSVSVTSPSTFSATASSNSGSARSGTILVYFNSGQPTGIYIAVNQPANTPDSNTIYGSVTNPAGIALPNVTLTFTNDTYGNNVDTTTSAGEFSEPVQYGWSGRIIPTMPGYVFDPSYRELSNVTSNMYDQDFTGSLVTMPTLPNPPSNLIATTLGSTQIYLTWSDNSIDEDGFKIERRTGTDGSWAQIYTVNTNTTNYLDSNLTTNTEYFYRVRAYNTAGNSEYSNFDSSTTGSSASNLAAPSNLTASVTASTQIFLSWHDNSNSENGFKIERKIGSIGTWEQITTVGSDVTSYINVNLAINTDYYYRIRAYNNSGDSDYSNEISANTSNAVQPIQTQNWLWADYAGGTQNEDGYGIATDNNGNSYITGCFTGTAYFGNTVLSSAGDDDIFVAKIDSNGNWLWAIRAGSSGDDEGDAITIDASGNCYVTGIFSNTAQFGTISLTSVYGYDVYVGKVNSNGVWVWVAQGGGSGGSQYGLGITADSAGNCYVTGEFNSGISFGSTSLTSFGERDIFIAKLNTSGNWLWAKQAGSTTRDYGLSVALGGSNSCYITGFFSGLATFGTITMPNIGGYDVFVAKLDTSGNWLWVKQAGGSGTDRAQGITADVNDNCYVSGYFQSTATFDSYTITSTGDYDAFVSKLDTNGNWVWAKRAGGTSDDRSNCIVMDNMGNIDISGYYNGNAEFGSASLSSLGSRDIFLAKLDCNGTWLSVTSAGGTDEEYCTGISSDNNGNSYVTGRRKANYATQFGPHTLPSINNGYDIFVAKTAPLVTEASFSADVVSGGAPLSVHFTDTSLGGNGIITNWLWNFGDGTTSQEQNPFHTYFSRGIYSVSLTIWNSSNTTNSITIPNMITVTNQPPQIVQDIPDLALNEDFSSFTINLNDYFSDADGDVLTYSVNYSPINANVSISGNILILASILNQSGLTNITVTADDMQSRDFSVRDTGSKCRATCSDTFIVNILPVNDPPVITLPSSFTYAEDSNLVINMAQYISDVDNTTLTLSAQNSAHISVSINGMIATLSASANWYGTEQIIFTVNDNVSREGTFSEGNAEFKSSNRILHENERVTAFSNVSDSFEIETRATSSSSVNVIVTPVNDAPAINLPDSFTYAEDGQLVINIADYANDIDGNPLTVTASGNQNVTVSITGMSVTLGALANWSGTELVTFTVNDNVTRAVVERGRSTASDIVSIIVTHVNDAPVINLPDSVAFEEDGSLVYNLAPYVSDVDNTNLTVTAQNSAHVNVAMNGLNATLTAAANWNGTESLSFTVSDGSLNTTDQINVIVSPINDAPNINLPDSFTYAEDGQLVINIADYASDIDGNPLTVTASGNQNVTVSITGMSVSLGALANWFGTEQVTFSVNDDMGRVVASDTADVIVSSVNDAPVITSFTPTQTAITVNLYDSVLFSVEASDIDSPISYSWFVNDVNQNIATSEFTYQITQNATYTVKAVVSDEDSSVEQLWTISVSVGNDDEIASPEVTKLYPGYPNPFNPETTIKFSLANPGWVNVSIYDIKGALIKVIKNETEDAGVYNVVWDGRTDHNVQVSSGLYFVKMQTEHGTYVKKITLCK